MKISCDWLKDYVDLKHSPERIAEILTMAGLSVDSVSLSGNDSILEIEVTSNRPDWLSYIGVARELAALTGGRFKIPRIDHRPGIKNKPSIKIKVEEPKLCPRYTARVIRGVKVASSPAWLAKRIEAMGLRPVNNVVDITNFCLFETGEPMHAFDLNRIKGGISVRRSAKGEKIKTIDGAERALDGSVLVIADDSGAVAVAGVIGGIATEVTGQTTDILLEAASFDPVITRRAARILGLATESSYRFERRVDPENILYSSDRAAALIRDIAGGSVEEFVDIRASSVKAKPAVNFSFARCNRLLGTDLAAAEMKKILTRLGLKTKAAKKDSATFHIPAFRADLKDEADLIEEIARIRGYDKIALTVPAIVDQGERVPKEIVCEGRVRKILSGIGFNEIMTYSLLPRRFVKSAGLTKIEPVEIKNPLSAEQEVMRPSLEPGMLNAIVWNINRRAPDLKLFEIGKVYFKREGDKFAEKRYLSMAVTGEIRSGWDGRGRKALFADLMGAFDEVMRALGMDEFSYSVKKEASGRFSPAAAAALFMGDKMIGAAGLVSPRALKDFDIKEDVYFCEACLDDLFAKARLEKHFKGLPKYPSVLRDISIVVEKTVSNADLVSEMFRAAPRTLKEARLIDRYSGKQIPGGKVSLTYRLEYQNPDKTLEEKEISEVHDGILKALADKFGAHLR